MAEALGKGLERRPLARSVFGNEWVEVARLAAAPDTMTPVAAVSDRYLALPGRYGYEQIALLALLGVSRRLPVTPPLAPLLRKVFDRAASWLLRLTRGGREALICSEYVFRCHAEALPGSGDPFEIRIAGLGRRRPQPGSLLEQMRRRGARRSPRTRGARRPRSAAKDLAALGEAYLASVGSGRRAGRGVEMPLEEVESALLRFGAAVAKSQRRFAGRAALRAPVMPDQAVAALERAVADFVTPGDLRTSPSLAARGRLDLGARSHAVRSRARRSAAPAKYALSIGINDYPGTGSDLAGCVNDSHDWSRAFRDRGFEVTALLDRRATGRAMREAIGALIARARTGDTVAIHFSGHGSFVPDEDSDEPDGTDECLCPHDVRANGPITDDELFQLYSSRQPGVRVVVFSDSCHSGTVARFAPIVTPPTMRGRRPPTRKVRFLPPAAFLTGARVARMGAARGPRRRSSPPGRYGALLLSGCQDHEYSFDGWFEGRPNGVFTWVALATLARLPRAATYLDWHQRIRRCLPSQQYAQTPNLYGSTAMKKWTVLA